MPTEMKSILGRLVKTFSGMSPARNQRCETKGNPGFTCRDNLLTINQERIKLHKTTIESTWFHRDALRVPPMEGWFSSSGITCRLAWNGPAMVDI